ncbi:hypothetical protein UPYG_G00044510 [Umbra pygmaea]|uniref:Uncharacterized protein n=1 Tax=Umbra pygmaea TaxID=75934 RepID=A0ABD0XTJ4_UMBPY
MQSLGKVMTQHTWSENTIWGGMCALFMITNSYNHRRRLRDIYNEVLQEWEAPCEEHISDLELEGSEDAEELPHETQFHDLETSHEEDVEEEELPEGVIKEMTHIIVTDEEDDEQLDKQSLDFETSHQEDVEEEELPIGVIKQRIPVILTDEEDDEKLDTQSLDFEVGVFSLRDVNTASCHQVTV